MRGGIDGSRKFGRSPKEYQKRAAWSVGFDFNFIFVEKARLPNFGLCFLNL